MSESSRIFVLEAESGKARPQSMRFEANFRVGPLSIGSQGQWPVTGPGVRDVHGYIAFDGSALYLQSASPLHPIRVGQVAVGERWHAVTEPTHIQVGGVRLELKIVDVETGQVEFAQPGQDEKTLLDPTPAALAPASKAPEPAVVIEYDDGDATVFAPPPRNAPILEEQEQQDGASEETARSPEPANSRIDLPPAPAKVPIRSKAPAAGHGRTGLAAMQSIWRAASLPRRATIVLLPVALVLTGFMFRKTWIHRRAVASTHASPSATGKPAVADDAGWGVVAMASGSRDAPAAPAAPTSAPVPEELPVAAASDGRSPERLAVEAVAAGAYGEAARRYADLARQHPEQRVYREAARIMRSRVNAGTP
jgi:hypothetical protein